MTRRIESIPPKKIPETKLQHPKERTRLPMEISDHTDRVLKQGVRTRDDKRIARTEEHGVDPNPFLSFADERAEEVQRYRRDPFVLEGLVDDSSIDLSVESGSSIGIDPSVVYTLYDASDPELALPEGGFSIVEESDHFSGLSLRDRLSQGL